MGVFEQIFFLLLQKSKTQPRLLIKEKVENQKSSAAMKYMQSYTDRDDKYKSV